mmetsp:Transcript_139156/g.259492  ORF Transcript_139156/g.259492 Transcript_139156/m.259492 type:complete len:332 (+) Transcript_139156:64-1059(+)
MTMEEKCIQFEDPWGRQISGASVISEVPSTVADSTFQWAEASQTLIFLDWDDTLFPTTELFDRWCLPQRPEEWNNLTFSQEQERILDGWRDALVTYLRNACTVSKRVVIVTNAKPGWVESCINTFVPSLKPFFSQDGGPRIVYAVQALQLYDKRSAAHNRGTPALWSAALSMEELHDQLIRGKFVAMQQEAKGFYSQYPDQTWKNIISVGDATYEYAAARDLTFRRSGPNRENLRTKCIVTPEAPALRDMTYTLSMTALLWPVFVAYDGDMDVNMNDMDDFRSSVNALGMPELKSLIRAFPIIEDREEWTNELDELAVIVQHQIMDLCSGG